MKQLTIQQWFARAVAAGLMPEWENVWAIYTKSGWVLRDCQGGKSYYIPVELSPISKSNTIQLRKDSKDLYSLEWRKPTKQDIGRHIWILERWSSTRLSYIDCSIADFDENGNNCTKAILADHGQIAPTEQNFKQAYGE